MAEIGQNWSKLPKLTEICKKNGRDWPKLNIFLIFSARVTRPERPKGAKDEVKRAEFTVFFYSWFLFSASDAIDLGFVLILCLSDGKESLLSGSNTGKEECGRKGDYIWPILYIL